MEEIFLYAGGAFIVIALIGFMAFSEMEKDKLEAKKFELCISAGMQYNNGSCIKGGL